MPCDARRRLLPDRSARRHQGIRQPAAGFHGQHRAGPQRRARRSASSSRRRAAQMHSGCPGHAEAIAVGEGFAVDGRRRDRMCAPASRRSPSSPAARTGRHETDALHPQFRGGRDRLGRLVAEILHDRQRRGRPLPALRPHHGMGHRGRRRGAARGRRHDHDARRRAARPTASAAAPTLADFANPSFMAKGHAIEDAGVAERAYSAAIRDGRAADEAADRLDDPVLVSVAEIGVHRQAEDALRQRFRNRQAATAPPGNADRRPAGAAASRSRSPTGCRAPADAP